MTMKYIRTKDEKIIKILKEGIDGFGKYGMIDEENCIRNYDDLKQADTVEELFDGYVIVPNTPYGIPFTRRVGDFDFLPPLDKKVVEAMYGFIKTDKGLIYKAKMKGVLPNGEIDWELL